MNFRNINRYLIIFLLFFLISCESYEFSPNKEEIDYENNIENKEELSSLDLNIEFKKIASEDFYDDINLSEWNANKNFLKLHTFKSYRDKNYDIRPLTSFIYNNNFIYLDYKSKLNTYELDNFKLIKSIQIQKYFDDVLSIPSSIAKIQNDFYIAYTNGKVLNINLKGNLNWTKNFQDIIKTPIKIYNNDLIILLSNKIISLDRFTGEINWEFLYEYNSTLQALGGDIKDTNQYLYFILPNNRVGLIDTIFGEKKDSLISTLNLEDSVDNSSDKIHVYNDILYYLDQNAYLSAINIFKNEILFNKVKVSKNNSYYFFNNSLITYTPNSFVKIYNIDNNNLFWEVNLSKYIKIEDKIIAVTSNSKSLIIVFKSGNIFELDLNNKEIFLCVKS